MEIFQGVDDEEHLTRDPLSNCCDAYLYVADSRRRKRRSFRHHRSPAFFFINTFTCVKIKEEYTYSQIATRSEGGPSQRQVSIHVR